MSGVLLWGWDSTNKKWVPVLVNEDGKLELASLEDAEISQDTPEDLKHVPHGYYAAGPSYLPLAVDSAGKLQVDIASLEHLNDIADVNVATPTDGYVLYYDDATGLWKAKAPYTSPLTTLGDLLRRGASADERLAIGSAGQVLTVVSGQPAWAAGAGGTKIEDADADTKVDTEESADEDKIRMDVKGVEALLLSDKGILTLAKQSICKVYMSEDQTIPSGAYSYPKFDTELSDVQSEFDNSVVSGTDDRADGEGADHLIDDTNSQFTSAMVGWYVWNTTDNTYAKVTAYNDAGDLTLDSAIFTNGEGYKLYAARFTATEAGTYLVLYHGELDNLADGKYLQVYLYKNGVEEAAFPVYGAGAYTGRVILTTTVTLAASDYLNFLTYQNTGSSQNLRGATSARCWVSILKLL